jgi:DNA repair protein RadC
MEDIKMTEIIKSTFWKDLKSGRFARMVREETRGRTLKDPEEVFNISKPLFAKNDDVEKLYCLFLDTRNHILGIEKLFTGTLTNATVYPREIVKRVLDLKAGAVVMVHNHNSGDTEPSREDKEVTRKVAMALISIDVSLHDHIIVGKSYFSFSEKGLMEGITEKINKYISGCEL